MNQTFAPAKDYKYGFKDKEAHIIKTPKGLSRKIVEEISHHKNEPKWVRDFRLNGFEWFQKKSMPDWGADLSGLDFKNIYYYLKPSEKQEQSWDDIPLYIKTTFDKLGVPQMEQDFLAGVGAQY
ncbi:MAG: Fe-S cluster assembly protein SufB, partial [Candidatus Jacksonbacteria bacterium]|nr:Fe-S cluster assembly protein SufB [Candidatus Jacksonbacteria bacterium]